MNKNGILSILGVKLIAVDCQSICEGELLFLIHWRKKIIMRVLASTGADLYPVAIYVLLDERRLGLGRR